MTGEKKGIGQLFKDTFNNYEMKGDNSNEWAAIEPKLSYLNFLHFGLFNFNIYYALLITGSVVLNIIFGLNYYSTKHNNNINKLIPVDSILVFDKNKSLSDETLIEYSDKNNDSNTDIPDDDNKIEKEFINNHVSSELPIGHKQEIDLEIINADILVNKPNTIKPGQGDHKIVMDSLPIETNKIIVTDTVIDFETQDTFTDILNVPGKKKKKTIIIKAPDVIERDTVIIMKKRKK